MEDILASIRKMISEERLGPRPIPDQIGRSPFGESVAETPAAGPFASEPRLEGTPAPAERGQPSFSSLSDALKAATPSPEQRLSLEDKIADMLESGEAAPRPARPTDSLAVFAATRQTSATSPGFGPLGAPPRSAVPDFGAERPTARKTPGPADTPPTARPGARRPDASSSGAQRNEERTARPGGASGTPRTAGPGSVTDPKVAPRVAEPKLGEPTISEPRKADAQRVIAMPPRPGSPSDAANGTGQAAASSPAAAAPMNGAYTPGLNGANVASMGLHGFQGSAPASKSPDARDTGLSAKSSGGLQAKSGDGAMRGKSDDRPTVAPAKDVKEPRPSREVPPPSGTAPSPVTAKKAPSDALVDAVVALVHREPDTLSVFTSGSAFIHGVTEEEEPVHKPGPNTAPKLDRSAAELLRPMLRQWLSDNMPRIVEDALRSELMSSEPEPKDSDKA